MDVDVDRRAPVVVARQAAGSGDGAVDVGRLGASVVHLVDGARPPAGEQVGGAGAPLVHLVAGRGPGAVPLPDGLPPRPPPGVGRAQAGSRQEEEGQHLQGHVRSL